jgi:ABC-type multidrug transport system fused ATPase/permease subunit
VAERGLHADLLEQDGVYARLYDMHHAAAQTVEP